MTQTLQLTSGCVNFPHVTQTERTFCRSKPNLQSSQKNRSVDTLKGGHAFILQPLSFKGELTFIATHLPLVLRILHKSSVGSNFQTYSLH